MRAFAGGRHPFQDKCLWAAPGQSVVGAHAVGQPIGTLRQGPVQSGTAVAIQHGGQYRQRQRVLVAGAAIKTGEGRHLERQSHIGLLGGGFHVQAAQAALGRFGARLALGQGACRYGAIVGQGQAVNLVGHHIADHHHHRIGRRIPLLVKSACIVGLHGIQIFHPTHDGAAIRGGAELNRRHLLVQQGAGRVFGAHAALLFDHFQLFNKFFVCPPVVGKPIGLKLHHIGQTLGRYLLKVAGVVPAGEGIFTPTQGGHTARKLPRLDAGGSFEEHVLEHMGHA